MATPLIKNKYKCSDDEEWSKCVLGNKRCCCPAQQCRVKNFITNNRIYRRIIFPLYYWFNSEINNFFVQIFGLNSKVVIWGWESKFVGNLVVETRKFSGRKRYWLASMLWGEELQFILISLGLNPPHISHLNLIPVNN